ncbi:hypothetical protein KSP40_PGU018519 [Platanthera guangdongensis]|uniref:DUF4057 domain-containing protein n=1 Tax=Platanthera guangdongensis TaxID=2320717 RepID=A0ABR2LU03_9ASPA
MIFLFLCQCRSSLLIPRRLRPPVPASISCTGEGSESALTTTRRSDRAGALSCPYSIGVVSIGVLRYPAGGQSSILLSKEEAVAKTVKKIHTKKFQDLTGNILKGGTVLASEEKPLSSAKLKEITGSDIFADLKATSRDYFGGVRKPPGGGSSIALGHVLPYQCEKIWGKSFAYIAPACEPPLPFGSSVWLFHGSREV